MPGLTQFFSAVVAKGKPLFAKLRMFTRIAVAIGIAIDDLAAVGAVLDGGIGSRVIHIRAAIDGLHV